MVNLDLTGCWWPDCYLCECGAKGASHTRAGATYTGTCLECGSQGVTAVYDGETGRSGYYRTTKGTRHAARETRPGQLRPEVFLFLKENVSE